MYIFVIEMNILGGELSDFWLQQYHCASPSQTRILTFRRTGGISNMVIIHALDLLNLIAAIRKNALTNPLIGACVVTIISNIFSKRKKLTSAG